jgi:hypothetical protein
MRSYIQCSCWLHAYHAMALNGTIAAPDHSVATCTSIAHVAISAFNMMKGGPGVEWACMRPFELGILRRCCLLLLAVELTARAELAYVCRSRFVCDCRIGVSKGGKLDSSFAVCAVCCRTCFALSWSVCCPVLGRGKSPHVAFPAS